MGREPDGLLAETGWGQLEGHNARMTKKREWKLQILMNGFPYRRRLEPCGKHP